MQFRASKIDGAWLHVPKILEDQRGSFHELFKSSQLMDELDFDFVVRQVNQSQSSAGVIRGIHWADNPPGQAKYVSCSAGAIVDVVVDLRLGSPTFGHWDSFELSSTNKHAVLISSGLGHAFLATENATVTYLCDQPFRPEIERTLSPFEPELAIDWASIGSLSRANGFLLSSKDQNAKFLEEFRKAGLLPRS